MFWSAADLAMQANFPVLHALADEGLHGRDVDTLGLGLLAEDTEHGQLSRHRLARTRRRAQQHILVRVVPAGQGKKKRKKINKDG